MEGRLLLALELDVVDARPVADLDLGHRVSLQLAAAEACVAFQEIERGALLDEDDVARDHAGRLAAVDVDEVDRLVEGHALGEAQADAAAHQCKVQGHDRIAVLSIDLAERGLQPARRLLQRLGDGDDLGAGCFQSGEVGQLGPELAFHDDQPVGREARDLGAERSAQAQPR